MWDTVGQQSPVSLQLCKEAGTSELSIWQMCSQGRGNITSTYTVSKCNSSSKLLPDSCVNCALRNEELCFGSPHSGAHQALRLIALAVGSINIYLHAHRLQTPPGHSLA